jgi:glycosyltransferase involved in cell wall biosynthesis
MKIALSIPGRFHFFNLASELEKRGHLAELITSRPKFEAVRYGIPRRKISSHPLKEILQWLWQRLPFPHKEVFGNPQYALHQIFDCASARALRDADILVASPSLYRHTMREAKWRGMMVIVDAGSSHSDYATRIVREEYERFGVTPPPFLLSDERMLDGDRRAFAEMDYIAVPSLFAKRSFISEGIPKEKLIHVPYGTDLEEFCPEPKKDNVFRVIYAGAMTLPKGVHYLLRAFTELNLPNSELLLVGSCADEMKPFFKKYEGKFRWVDHVRQRELRHYYSQSSVFAIASIQEGLAMVQLQAMACGLPVIATTNTGAEDVVREGVDGFILPIRDVDALKSKILFYYRNPEARARMGATARERVASGFTWDDYGDRIVAEYQRVLLQ